MEFQDSLPRLDKNSSARSIDASLKKSGVVVIDDFVTDLEPLQREAHALLDKHAGEGDYNFGKYAGLRTEREINMFSNISNFFTQPLVHEVSQLYIGKQYHLLNALYVTHEFKESEVLQNNGQPHFDQSWAFKFFLYLSNVTKDSGAFRCLPGSTEVGRKLREQSYKQVKVHRKVKNKVMDDYMDLGVTPDQFLPVEGKAGTMIIFDSDTFHYGGNLKDGNERLIMRSHNTKNSSNSILQKTARKIKSVLYS